MKQKLKISALSLIVACCSLLPNSASAQYDDDYYDDDREVSYQTFYDELSPHGRWIDYPGQGYVWVPDTGPDFRPYSTNGHWVWTENYEWMWVSDYDWGWAPFHYGRWDNDPYYGWYWVPGYEWSPAWVAWRDGGDYYGWAPIRPGINISINFNIGGYAPPNDFWCFTPRRYITSRNLHHHYIDRRQNITIIHQTTIINNFNYGNSYGFRSGPRRMDAERYTGRINPVRFRSISTPGRTQLRNNEINVYRPSFRENNNNRNIAPRNFERYDRNNVGSSRNDNITNRNSNLPNRQLERRNERQRNDNNEIRNQRDDNNRRFDRTVNERPNRNRNINPTGNNEQPSGTQPGNNRRFDRRVETERPTRSTDIRRPQNSDRTVEQGNNNRQFERRNMNNGNSGRTMERQETSREFRQQPQTRQQRVDMQPGSTERRIERNSNRPQGNEDRRRF